MSWTKRQFVEQALEQIGIAAYTFDTQAEQLQSAARQLDAMLAGWNLKGLQVGYPLPTSPENTDLDTETDVPDKANEAIYLNLALRLAPSFGRQVMPELKQFAFYSYQNLLASFTLPAEMQFPSSLPRGQGNKPWREDLGDTFSPEPHGPYQPWDTK